jgi:hypothetical protein
MSIMSTESAQTTRWKKRMTRLYKSGMFEKLHGNMYQIGVPDGWAIMAGLNVMIEFKMGAPRTAYSLARLLRPRQRLVLARMGHRDACGFVVCRKRKVDEWAFIDTRDLIGDLDVGLVWMSMDESIHAMWNSVKEWKHH